jgi:hypothetical protein
LFDTPFLGIPGGDVGKGDVTKKASSLTCWLIFLLLLNIIDILVTNPVYEVNPITRYIWREVGYFPAAGIKVGQVVLLGILVASAKKFATPSEWLYVRRLFRGMVILLVTFYIFVVAWNSILFIAFPSL